MRFPVSRPLVSRPLASLFLALAACPGPKEPPAEEPLPSPSVNAKFADASEDERALAVMAALGFGPVYATFAQFQADGDARSVNDDNEPNGCPAYDVLGEAPLRVRYAADGCTAPSGATYDGTLEVTNPLQWEDVAGERTGGTSMVAKKFAAGDILVDGTWSQTETAPNKDATTHVDLAVTVSGETLRLAGKMDITWIDGAARTVCADGLRGAVDGVGAFDVACDVRDFGGPTSGGFVELDGVDILRVELVPDEDGCLPATIDGEQIAPICLGDEGGGGGGDGSLDDDVFGGSGLGCVDGEMFLDAQTELGAAAGVEIALAGADATADEVEIHSLKPDDGWADPSYEGWRLELASDGYISGVSSKLSCEDFDTLHAAYFAYDADGQVIGCQLAGMAYDAGPIDLSECPRR